MADLFYKNSPLLGFEINNTDIKIMSIDPTRWKVQGYGSIDMEPKKLKASLEDNDPYLGVMVKNLMENNIVGELLSKYVALGLPTSRSYSRTFTIPRSEQNKVQDAVELEVTQYIPVPFELLYVDYEIISKTKKDITVVVTAIPKVTIDNSIKACEEAGLTVVAVEPGINAIARLVKVAENGDLPTLIIDINPSNTDIAILDKVIRVTGGTPVGGSTFTLDIAKKLSIPLENAHQFKVLNGLNPGPRQQKIKAAIEPSLQRITTEVRRVLRYYTERMDSDQKIEQVLIVGGGSNVPGIGEYFTNDLLMPVRVASPWQKLDFGSLKPPTKQFRPRYLTVAGLGSLRNEEVWK